MHTLTLALDTASQVSTRLPWGWYAGLTAIDAGLVGLVLRQRSRRMEGKAVKRAADRPPVRTAAATSTETVELTGMVRRQGWLVPAARAGSVPRVSADGHPWPVHRDYLRSRIS